MKNQLQDDQQLSPLRWLLLLLLFQTVLLTFEVVMGYSARSLALIGDAGHGLLDILSTLGAVVCERLKSSNTHSPRIVAVLDILVFVFVIALVASGSCAVWDLAFSRLVSTPHHHMLPTSHDHDNVEERARGLTGVWKDLFGLQEGGHDHGKDMDVDGRLIFAFAICSMLLNASMGMVGYHYVQKAHGSWWDWAHAALHPGCTATNCSAAGYVPRPSPQCVRRGRDRENSLLCTAYDDCGDEDCEAHLPGGETLKPQEDPPLNLNMVVIWIHVVCDAIKDLVLIVASFLMMMKLVSAKAADAASALAVVGLMILGAVWVLPGLWIRVQQVWSGGAQEMDAAQRGEAEALLKTGEAEGKPHAS